MFREKKKRRRKRRKEKRRSRRARATGAGVGEQAATTSSSNRPHLGPWSTRLRLPSCGEQRETRRDPLRGGPGAPGPGRDGAGATRIALDSVDGLKSGAVVAAGHLRFFFSSLVSTLSFSLLRAKDTTAKHSLPDFSLSPTHYVAKKQKANTRKRKKQKRKALYLHSLNDTLAVGFPANSFLIKPPSCPRDSGV